MEVLVTSGAYEALYAAITGHIDTGDEAIIIEPFFDCYEPMIKCAGGVCRYIPLKPVSSKHLCHIINLFINIHCLETNGRKYYFICRLGI